MSTDQRPKVTLIGRIETIAFWLEQRREHFTDAMAIYALDTLKDAQALEVRVAELEAPMPEAIRCLSYARCSLCGERYEEPLGCIEAGHIEGHEALAALRAALSGAK